MTRPAIEAAFFVWALEANRNLLGVLTRQIQPLTDRLPLLYMYLAAGIVVFVAVLSLYDLIRVAASLSKLEIQTDQRFANARKFAIGATALDYVNVMHWIA